MATTKQKAVGGMSAAAVAMIGALLALEGGYVNHPNDPGGETNFGITKRVAVKHGYTGPMKTLPREVATNIYYKSYLVELGYGPLVDLDAAVTEELLDTTANMGPARPGRMFQASINAVCLPAQLTIDGKVGPATVAKFAQCQRAIGATPFCRQMLDALDGYQLAEYHRLVRVNPRLKVFFKGWVNKRIGNVDRAKCGVWK